MTKLHRKELKQDEVRLKVTEAVRNVSLHGREVMYIIAVVAAVGFIAFAWFYYDSRQQEQSQNLLSVALDKFNAPVGEQNQQPGVEQPRYRYKTDTEKYTAALKDFEDIARKYGNTPAGEMAQYQAGVAAFYLGDLKRAEEYLRQGMKVSEKNPLYYQSRVALADIYLQTKRPEQAIEILKQASEKKNPSVPPEFLLMQLAQTYSEAGKQKEASEVYRKIVDTYKDSPISYQAQMRLESPGK